MPPRLQTAHWKHLSSRPWHWRVMSSLCRALQPLNSLFFFFLHPASKFLVEKVGCAHWCTDLTSFMSAGLSQPRPTFQLPVYLNLCLMSPGECFSLSLLRLVSHIFLFSLHLKRAICKMYFENGLKQTELSFAPLCHCCSYTYYYYPITCFCICIFFMLTNCVFT